MKKLILRMVSTTLLVSGFGFAIGAGWLGESAAMVALVAGNLMIITGLTVTMVIHAPNRPDEEL